MIELRQNSPWSARLSDWGLAMASERGSTMNTWKEVQGDRDRDRGNKHV